jgi:hypothetical protein
MIPVITMKVIGKVISDLGASTPTKKVPNTAPIELMKSMTAEAFDLSSAYEIP